MTPAGPTAWRVTRQANGEPAQGEPIGRVRVASRAGQGEIDFRLDPAHRGMGYASAAVRSVSDWALDPHGGDLGVLLWRAEVGNWPARRVVWACGYRVEGRVRGLLSDADGPRDGWSGALQRDDPRRPLLPWWEPAEIRLGDLMLRPNADGDIARIAEACRDPASQQFLVQLPNPYGAEEARAFLLFVAEEHAGASSLNWAIASVHEPERILGEISLVGLSAGISRAGEIGYWIHPDARRNGYARAATRMATRHALLPENEGGMGLDRVLLRAAESNTGSLEVAHQAGFRNSGLDRMAQRLRDGSCVNLVRFEMIASELDEAWAHPSCLR